jgi:hypothetical protein
VKKAIRVITLRAEAVGGASCAAAARAGVGIVLYFLRPAVNVHQFRRAGSCYLLPLITSGLPSVPRAGHLFALACSGNGDALPLRSDIACGCCRGAVAELIRSLAVIVDFHQLHLAAGRCQDRRRAERRGQWGLRLVAGSAVRLAAAVVAGVSAYLFNHILPAQAPK